jgi:hypothetical protein
MMTGSVVDKDIWQAYKNQNVKVLGINVQYHVSKDSVIAWADRFGITFPVATDSVPVDGPYLKGNESNKIILIDTKGIVRDIAYVEFPRIDSIVQSVAGKIPALLATAIQQRHIKPRTASNGATIGAISRWSGDLKGRRLKSEGAANAPQLLIGGAGSVKVLNRRW